jgi:hypothetical protein
VNNILPIAQEYGLSAYAAAYLEVTVRHAVPPATLSGALQKARKAVDNRKRSGTSSENWIRLSGVASKIVTTGLFY